MFGPGTPGMPGGPGGPRMRCSEPLNRSRIRPWATCGKQMGEN